MNANPAFPDFDILVTVHQNDPSGYEVLRRYLLQECVTDAPDEYQPMLNDLVWRMGEVRAEASSPLDAAVAANGSLMEAVDRGCPRFCVIGT